MVEIHEKYIVDEFGRKKAVVLDFEEWKAILDILEELDDVHLYDEAKSRKEDIILFDDALNEIKEGLV